MGYGWRHTYHATLRPVTVNTSSYLKILDETGRGIYFIQSGALYEGVNRELSHIEVVSGQYVWHRSDDRIYIFDSDGRLVETRDVNGNRQLLSYNADSLLETVTDEATGRIMTFHYDARSRIDTITGPVTPAVGDGIWADFGYDDNDNLTSVSYPDGSGFTYSYDDPNDMHNLTGKADSQGHILSQWGYDLTGVTAQNSLQDNQGHALSQWGFDATDRAVSSTNREGKNVTIDYSDTENVAVTDGYGVTRIYGIDTFAGRKKVTTVSGIGGCSNCGSDVVRYDYDADRNLVEKEYANGRIDMFSNHDSRGNPGTVVRAAGTSDQQTVTFTYHPAIDAPLSRTEASVLGSGNKVTTWDYDNDGNTTPNENPTRLVHRIIETGYTKNVAGTVVPYEYITANTYNSKGQLTSVDGMLPGTTDTTVYTYDPVTGNLLTVTQPLIGTITYGNYNEAGHPGHMIDVNGHQTDFTYDGKNRLLSATLSGLATSRTYTESGIHTVTDTGGRTLTYTYDPQYGRLTRITDDLGNYLSYGYDSNGNRIEDSAYNASDIRTRWKRFDYQHPDQPGQLWKVIHPDNSEIVYGYDTLGRVSSVQNERRFSTAYAYDILARPEKTTQPGDVITRYDYDTGNNRVAVTDANAHTTTFIYDDYGRVISETSPDRGTTTSVHDVANNRVLTTDAKGITIIRTYDALGRVSSVTCPHDPAVSMGYDSGTHALGRLSFVTDQSGQSAYAYDIWGHITSETRTHTGMPAAVVSYGHSATTGYPASMTYPGGMVLSYDYDAAGRISSIQANGENVVSNITYRPFGPVEDYTFGNALLTVDQTFNLRDQVDRIQAGAMDYQYSYYADGTVKKISGVPFPPPLLTGTTSFAYQTGSNKLDASTGAQTKNYTTDANGNITSDGTNTFIYDENNRLTEVLSKAQPPSPNTPTTLKTAGSKKSPWPEPSITITIWPAI